MNFNKISADDLINFINLLPHFESSYQEMRVLFSDNPGRMTPPGFVKPKWCELYELSIQSHIDKVVLYTGRVDQVKKWVSTQNPTRTVINQIKSEIDNSCEDDEPFDEHMRPLIAATFGFAASIYFSFKSLMIFGLYLNELVALSGEENEKSDHYLFNAVKIDPTVIGCTRVVNRISLALLKNDTNFIVRLKRSLAGKLTKREQKNYQLQRLVLQVLLETGASNLSHDDLYELFVNQLKIVAKDRNSDVGDVANNLRQFSYHFMKQKAVSENP